MKNLFYFLLLFILQSAIISGSSAQVTTDKPRVIIIGAHPDDPDEAGGTAALLVSMGCQVKFLAVTNGDAGHETLKGKELADIRYKEAQEAGKRLGVTYDILDNHDGLLLPTLEVRLQIIRKIREWNADVVIAPRPNDYHPDHRYTGVLVQDAAYMVAVPDIASETPALKKNPVFLYLQDHFKRPNPFRPDIAVDISSVYDKKVSAFDAHKSQVYDWLPWIGHYSAQVPAGENDRLKWLAGWLDRPITPEIRASLEKWYGKDKAASAAHVEVFEVCEYGTQPTDTDIRKLFPMLGK